MRRLVAMLLAFPLLSGCTGGADDADGGAETPVLITDPLQNRTLADSRPHVHDYWGGKMDRTVVDAVIEAPGYAWNGPGPLSVAEFRPESGDVVPQGSDRVELTISWTDDDDLNVYSDPEVWVKRANESEPMPFMDVQSGDTFVVPTGNASNDLPHQLLSAWIFQLRLHGDPSDPKSNLFNMSYSGEVTLKAVAYRASWPIPLFEGHPDQWQGRTEITLLELSGDMMFDGDTESGDWRCYMGDPGCPFYMVPSDGAVVPLDADHVTIELTRAVAQNPARMGVKYHGALSRDFEVPAQLEETDAKRTYTVPVEGGGDGPYATQSQWEFLFYISDPMEDDLFVYEEFELRITAHKGP